MRSVLSGVKSFTLAHFGKATRLLSVVAGLGVTSAGTSIEAAVATAYEAAARIRFEGMHYRKDIAADARRVQAAGD